MSVITTEGSTSNGSRNGLKPHSGDAADTDELCAEEVFEILSNNRRRRVISYLRENGKTSDIRTLSERLAAAENDVGREQVTSKQRMRTYTALRQSHLPKMDRKGVVDFDENSGSVSLNSTAGQLEKYLNEDLADESRWIRYYLGIGLFGVGITLGAYGNVSVFAMMPDVLAGLIVSVAIIVVSLTRHWPSGG